MAAYLQKLSHHAKRVCNTALFVLAVISLRLDVVIWMILFVVPAAVLDKFALLLFDVQVFLLCCILTESSRLKSVIVYSRK